MGAVDARVQTRAVEVPVEAAIAIHTRTKQLESRAEQEQLKKLVLDYEARDEAERRRSACALPVCYLSVPTAGTDLQTSAARQGFKVTFKPAPD
jgi:allophanate hydrolase subunit 1